MLCCDGGFRKWRCLGLFNEFPKEEHVPAVPLCVENETPKLAPASPSSSIPTWGNRSCSCPPPVCILRPLSKLLVGNGVGGTANSSSNLSSAHGCCGDSLYPA